MDKLPFLTINGVDTTMGLDYHDGVMRNYRETLKAFYDDGVTKPDQIRDCLEKNDIKLYTTLVHGLKGDCMTIGAQEAADFARELENAGKSRELGLITERTDSFLNKLDTLLQSINEAITD